MPNKPLGLTIDPEFRRLLPPLTEEQRDGLLMLITKHGFLEPISVWEHNGDQLIIDGHNRYDIWLKFPANTTIRPPVVRLMHFPNRIAVSIWIIEAQAARRNWTPQQRKDMLGALYNLRKKQRGAQLGNTNNKKDELANLAHLTDNGTRSTLAASAGTSESYIKDAANYNTAMNEVRKSDPELAGDILSGKTKIPDRDVVAALKEPDIAATLRARTTSLKTDDKSHTATIDKFIAKIAAQIAGIEADYGKLFVAIDQKKKTSPSFASRHSSFATLIRTLGANMEPVKACGKSLSTAWNLAKPECIDQ